MTTPESMQAPYIGVIGLFSLDTHAMPFLASYYQQSLAALNRALYEVPALAAWQTFDPGVDKPVDARYHAMPALTKADLRRQFPAGFVPRNQDVNAAIAAGDILVEIGRAHV